MQNFAVRFYPVVLLLLWAALILVVNPAGDFPLNDDWRYAFPVQSLYENGYLTVSDDFAPSIILQVLWGALFCEAAGEFSFTVLRFSTLTAGFIGLIFFYKLLLKLCEKPTAAFFGTLILALNPLYFNLSFSFMTDVPFATLLLAGLLAFFKFIRTKADFWLILTALSGAAAFYVRQPGLLLLVMSGAYLCLDFRKNKLRILGLAAFTVAVYLGFDKVVKPLLGDEAAYVPVTHLFKEAFFDNPVNFVLEICKKILKTVIYTGFFTLPLLPFLRKQLKDSGALNLRFLLVLSIFNLGLLYFLHLIDKIFPFGGNIMYNFGLGPELLTDVYTFGLDNGTKIPVFWMYLISFISQTAGGILLFFIWKKIPRLSLLQKHFFGFTLLLNAMYLPLMSITSFYDRYLLLIFISVWLFLIPFADFNFSSKKSLLYSLPFLLLSWFSIAGTHDYLAWHRVKFELYRELRAENVPTRKIDAGFELNSWYNFQKGFKSDADKSFWWVNDDLYMFTFGKTEQYKEYKKAKWSSWLTWERRDILILKKE